jgi:hypothetical protein
MKLKLQSTLKLKADQLPEIDISEDVDLIELPDDLSDEQFKKFFENFRESKKRKYVNQILSLFDVEIKEIKSP